MKFYIGNAIYIIEWGNLIEKNARMPCYILFVHTLRFSFTTARNYFPPNVSTAWKISLHLLYEDRLAPTEVQLTPLLTEQFLPAFLRTVHLTTYLTIWSLEHPLETKPSQCSPKWVEWYAWRRRIIWWGSSNNLGCSWKVGTFYLFT